MEDRKVIIESIQIDEGLIASVKTQQQGIKNTLHALKKDFVVGNIKGVGHQETTFSMA